MQSKKSFIFTIVFGIGIFTFFYLWLPHHFHFKEQFQLFLFTKSYFIETCYRPGGLSNYIGRFFTQFYIFSWAGALTLSLMLTVIQLLISAIGRKFCKTSAAWFLSFFPVIYYWYILCDSNSTLGGVVAILLVLFFVLFSIDIKSNTIRHFFFLIMMPVIYWIAGGAIIMAVVLILLYEWIIIKKDKKTLALISFFALFLAVLCPFVAKFFIIQYPFARFFWGVDYVHFIYQSPQRIAYLWAFIVLIIFILPYISMIRIEKLRSIFFPVQVFVIVLTSFILIWKIAYPFYASNEEIMAYDYYCRVKKWDEIIKMANKKSPTVPMTVTCLNLALFKTGQLPEKMFDYYQNGVEGLLPSFQRDFMIPTVAAEPYYYLGFVNTAQRFVFEAMEAFPDYQKSGRNIKRLVETNIINGHYKIAEKYLSFLDITLFYKKWAKEVRKFLYNEDMINSHHEWGEIRRFQTKNDFLFSGQERDRMLAVFFQQNTNNRMAYEYLLAHALLSKDMNNFPDFFRLGHDFSSPAIPKSYQEALIYIWGLTNKLSDPTPFPVSQSVLQSVSNYAQIYTSNKTPEPLLKQRFSKTFWYYLHFKELRQQNQNTPYLY